MISKREYQIENQEKVNDKQNNIDFDFGLNQKLRNDIANLKKPYLNRIQFSKLKVNSLKSKQINQQMIQQQIDILRQKQSKHNTQVTQKTIYCQDKKNKFIRLSSFQQQEKQIRSQNKKQIDLPLTEWPGRDKQKIFKNSTKMNQEYHRIFKQKNYGSFKKQNVSAFKKAQNDMLLKIYQQIKNSDQQTVSFKKVLQFLQSHKNFIMIYDLNPSKINDILHFSAQKYEDKLTKLQFLRIFSINHSNQKQDEDQVKYQIKKHCCLQEQNWKQLKRIFTELDTFGDGYIKTQELFSKMKKISVNKQLMQANTIYFPNIKKYYSFKKIIFQFQYKDKFPDVITWQILQDKIINFQHINYPTIDEISLQLIKKAYILQDSQSFMLKEIVLSALKKQFKQCPKFCNNFIKCKYFCTQLLTSNQIKPFLNEYVRADVSKSQKFLITLQNNIKFLKIYGPDFIDLDEMLFYFSVKGFDNQLRIINYQRIEQIQSDIEQEFQQRKKQKQKLRIIKSIQKVQKIMKSTQKYSKNLKNKQNKNIIKTTFIQEFNITKKRDHLTIRQQKLRQMIKQKLSKQKAQIKSYVKARSIPVSINGQQYLVQKSKFQDKKQKQKLQRQQKRIQDQKKLKYLMSNTKLFNKSNILQQSNKKIFLNSQRQNFQAKPIEWYVKQRNLLQIIQNQKQQRRKNKFKQTKQKYIYGYWKDLPYDAKKSLSNQHENRSNQSKGSLQKQLKTNKQLLKLKQNIKARQVPDFKKLHKQFTQKLQSKKKQKNPTIIKQFNLTSPKLRTNKQQNIIQIISPSKIKIQDKQLIIGTTKKFECMVEKNHQKIIQKQQQQHRKYLQQIQRQNKRKVFAKFMQNALKQQNKKNNKQNKLSKNIKNKYKKNIRQKNIRQKQLNKMYQRVLCRPFLFQNIQSSKIINIKKQKHQKKYKNQNKQKLIKKIIIPKQNQDQRYLNAVEQVQWEDKQTQRINYDDDNESYQQQDQNNGNQSQFQSQNQEDQNQGQYQENTTIKSYHNQSF